MASRGHSKVTKAVLATPACPHVRDILTRVGDKWSILIVMQLGGQTLRFSELRRRIDGISQRMRTVTLRSLERDGLVQRVVTPSVPPRVDYLLTPLGGTLLQAVQGLAEWVTIHIETIEAARASFDAQESAQQR